MMDPTAPMELTQEQLERIQKNQQRARELRQEKEKITKKLQETIQRNEDGKETAEGIQVDPPEKIEKEKQEIEILEDFEVGASDFITKEQCKEQYCLPLASIDLCSFIVKENPKCPKFAPMKLFSRKEIRKRARERFGGLEGLQQERIQRQEKRLKKDMETCQHVFESKKEGNE